MKKMTILAVLLVLAIALTACAGKTAEETTAATTVPVETTAPQTQSQPLTLTDWNMSASTWSSPNGATIHISATPSHYADGQKANFIVRLEGDDIASIPCQWDGTSYTASADLNAANGYCYYMLLTAADGTSTEVAVNTPNEPVNESLINMEAALASYCSVTIDESDVSNQQLTLSKGKVQVQVPSIVNDGETITCQEAVLVLSYTGKELSRHVLTLSETAAAGLYEADLNGISFTVPEMEAEQKIELMLHVTLSNAHVLSAYGGNWIYSADELLPVLG